MPPATLYDQTARSLGFLPPDPAEDLLRGGNVRPPGQNPIQPLNPQEESTLLEQLGSGAASGLSWLGGSLGKAFGGRAIRGVLGGNLRELASIIPFSDTLGITDPEQEVRGSELLGDKHADLLSPEGVGGLGLDILLDPATYLTFGGSAVNSLGQAAKKAGVLPKSIVGRIQGLAAGSPELDALATATGRPAADIAGQTLGGVAGLRVPFTEPTALLGTGATGQKIGGAIDRGLDWLKYSKPVRSLSALFDPSVGGATSEAGQRAARGAYDTLQGGLATARGKQLELLRTLQEHDALGTGQALRSAVELPGSFLGPYAPDVYSGLETAAGQARSTLGDMLKIEQQLGIPVKELNDTAKYFPRYQTILDKDTKGFNSGARQVLPTGHPSLVGREDILRDFPAGTEGVNQLIRDKDILAPLAGNPDAGNAVANSVRRQYLGMGPADEQAMHDLVNGFNKDPWNDAARRRLVELGQAAPGSLAPAEAAEFATLNARQRDFTRMEELKGTFKQSEGLADWLPGLDPQYTEKGLDFFGNHPATDFLTRALHHERAVSGTNAVHDLLAANAEVLGQAGPGMVPLRQALIDAGLGEAGTVTDGAMRTQLQRLAANGKNLQGGFDSLMVPADIAQDAARYTRAISSPEGLEPFLKVFDAVTNFTKAAQTTIWPAFHVRNGVTGLFMNWVTGAYDPRYGGLNPLAYLAPIQDAMKLRAGGVIEGANAIKGLEHLTEQQATQALADELYRAGVGSQKNLFQDVIGQGEHAAQQQVPRLPGMARPSFGEMLAGGVPQTLTEANPLNVSGAASNVDLFAPARAGRQVGEAVDEVNRAAAYIAKRRQGFEPATAAMEVKAAHFDYTQLTPFERSVMRRVVPFYNWISNNLPFAVDQLIREPGGKLGTVIKAAGEARGAQPGFLPDYLGEGLALPIGAEEGGTKRFLSHTGLPFEDLAQSLSVKGALGTLNPLLKAPLELATGKQFYSGRDLADLYSTTGSVPADELLANLPTSRFMSTGRTLLDDRKSVLDKAVNLLTGAHLSDVDMNKAKDVAVREMIDQELRGNPAVSHFQRLGVRPGQEGNLSAYETMLLRLNATREAARRTQPR